MQDEERYMTLNVQLKKRNSIQTSQLKCKDCSVMLRWYKILLGISGTVNGILVLTLISLSLLVSQGVLLKCQKRSNSNISQHGDMGNWRMNSDAPGNKKDADNCVSRATEMGEVILKFISNFKGPRIAKPVLKKKKKFERFTFPNVQLTILYGLCPSEWLKYQKKCYWFSNELKSWSDSYGYCLERKSHLLIIQDQLEMTFIQKNLKQSNYVWIGLNFTFQKSTWTWVDGSPLNSKIFFIKGPATENSCGTIKEKKIYSEACSSVFKWICQY